MYCLVTNLFAFSFLIFVENLPVFSLILEVCLLFLILAGWRLNIAVEQENYPVDELSACGTETV